MNWGGNWVSSGLGPLPWESRCWTWTAVLPASVRILIASSKTESSFLSTSEPSFLSYVYFCQPTFHRPRAKEQHTIKIWYTAPQVLEHMAPCCSSGRNIWKIASMAERILVLTASVVGGLSFPCMKPTKVFSVLLSDSVPHLWYKALIRKSLWRSMYSWSSFR